MTNIKKDYKFLSHIILLISLFILVLFTKGQFENIQENMDIKEAKEYEHESLKEELKELNKDKEEMKNNENDFSKYKVKFKEDDMIDYIYSYVEDQNRDSLNLVIKGISFTEPKINELGFNEVEIDISAYVGSEKIMKNFLDFFINDKSKYKFIITQFSYPDDGRGDYTVSIPLKMYFK